MPVVAGVQVVPSYVTFLNVPLNGRSASVLGSLANLYSSPMTKPLEPVSLALDEIVQVTI